MKEQKELGSFWHAYVSFRSHFVSLCHAPLGGGVFLLFLLDLDYLYYPYPIHTTYVIRLLLHQQQRYHRVCNHRSFVVTNCGLKISHHFGSTDKPSTSLRPQQRTLPPWQNVVFTIYFSNTADLSVLTL